jgi:hypothetical protein
MNTKHKITKQSYEHNCGDGCCCEQGDVWSVDGTVVFQGPDHDQAILAILQHFNIDSEMVGIDETGEEIWIL